MLLLRVIGIEDYRNISTYAYVHNWCNSCFPSLWLWDAWGTTIHGQPPWGIRASMVPGRLHHHLLAASGRIGGAWAKRTGRFHHLVAPCHSSHQPIIVLTIVEPLLNLGGVGTCGYWNPWIPLTLAIYRSPVGWCSPNCSRYSSPRFVNGGCTITNHCLNHDQRWFLRVLCVINHHRINDHPPF